MKTHKFLSLLLVSLMLFVVLAACGGKAKKNEEKSATPAATQAAPTPPQAPAATNTTVALDANKLIDERCTVCHSRDRIDAKKASGADRAAWETTVDRMIGKGAQLNADEREAVLTFLAGS